ncbi:sensor histidine kinase [Nocardioides sp.]|uniref:sensor histidine kinase n=1 Tax=Nocardioides sp. TaxID=35761 RepID=UPI002EDB953E
MSQGRPVARLVQPLIVRVAAMAVLMAVIAVAGVLLSTTAVNRLTEDLQPAAAANQDLFQDLTDMSAAVEAWSAGGQQAAVDRFGQALARFPADQRKVARFAAGDNELEMLVTRQERAATVWIEKYAQPRMSAAGGVAPEGPQLRGGAAAFDAVRAAHQETAQAFDSRVRTARSDASVRLKGTVLVVLLLALASWYVVSRARRRLTTDLTEPLLELERAVHRMAKQDGDVRAPEAGPKEVRAVAAALNAFADGQRRAQAVEGRIQNELRSLDTARDDFVSNVSHELRTPLTTISGYLELVAEEFEDRMEPRHERMLEATRRNVDRLKALIDDLLALSRAEGRSSVMEPVDLGLLLREVVTDVRITAARRGIRLAVVTPEDVVPVLADRAMLHRALLNVLTNAVKFSHDEGTVEVVLRVAGREVEVGVTDHGIGIPAAEIDRLGTRFFRASNAVTNEIAGTGLGLRITQTIVDRHSGDLVIESREGEGTTVAVRLALSGEGAPPPMPHEIVAEEEAVAAVALTPEAELAGTDGDPSTPRIVPAFPRRG